MCYIIWLFELLVIVGLCFKVVVIRGLFLDNLGIFFIFSELLIKLVEEGIVDRIFLRFLIGDLRFSWLFVL